MQAAVSVQPPAWVVVALLFNSNYTVKHRHVKAHNDTDTIPIPIPIPPARKTKGQTVWISSKTQRGTDRAVLQGRVGNHL